MDFSGDDKNKNYNGAGNTSWLYYNGAGVQYQKRVIITFSDAGVGESFIDNRNNSLASIEEIDASDLSDKIEITYGLGADKSETLLSGEPFWLEIFLNDGSDVLTISPSSIPFPSAQLGATISGGGGNDSIRAGAMRDHIFGGEGNDTIYGNSGNDLITGDNGSDTIYGGNGDDNITLDGFTRGGSDKVIGGAGDDTVILSADKAYDVVILQKVSDSTVAEDDSIFYFEAAYDKIDLSAIDANTKLAGDQAFKLANALTGIPGQLIHDIFNPGTAFVRWEFSADVNGDGKIDLQFNLIAPKLGPGVGLADWFVL